ncbi:hypothetical protein [Streptomyces koyangensis]
MRVAQTCGGLRGLAGASRSVKREENSAVAVMPTTIGSVRRPDSVAVLPYTVWRQVGT